MKRLRPQLGGFLTALCLGFAAVVSAGPAGDAPVPPLPSAVAHSPVDTFRELLAMEPATRAAALSNRPPEIRKRLLAKLREYAALPPDERELRLRATELHWYLNPLLAAPATNRPALLAQVPTELRTLVNGRLMLWNATPPALQRQLLEDDRLMRLYLQLESSTPEQRERFFQIQPGDQRQRLQAGYDQWRALPPAERQKALDRVNQFFELTRTEKAKVLATLSEPERHQMERTLQAFEQLPPDTRARCVRAFGRFASLPPAERAEFLKNAQRWQAMSPAERETFRQLVQQAPILPPLPTPPLPPPSSARLTAATTNGR